MYDRKKIRSAQNVTDVSFFCSDNHETCHLDFNFQLDYASHDSYFLEFAPTTIDENKFAYVESSKISMLVDL